MEKLRETWESENGDVLPGIPFEKCGPCSDSMLIFWGPKRKRHFKTVMGSYICLDNIFPEPVTSDLFWGEPFLWLKMKMIYFSAI